MISPLVGLVLLALPLTTSPRPLTAVPADALVFRSSSTLSSFAIASSSSSSLGQVCPGCTSFGDVAQVCFLQAGAGGDFNKTLVPCVCSTAIFEPLGSCLSCAQTAAPESYAKILTAARQIDDVCSSSAFNVSLGNLTTDTASSSFSSTLAPASATAGFLAAASSLASALPSAGSALSSSSTSSAGEPAMEPRSPWIISLLIVGYFGLVHIA